MATPGSGTDLARWAGRWPGKVAAWPTNQYPRMAPATRVWWQAVKAGEWGHDDNPDLVRHLRNMCRRDTRVRDQDTGEILWVPGKETNRSPLKIDYGVACILAWQARIDAQAAGGRPPQDTRPPLPGNGVLKLRVVDPSGAPSVRSRAGDPAHRA